MKFLIFFPFYSIGMRELGRWVHVPESELGR